MVVDQSKLLWKTSQEHKIFQNKYIELRNERGSAFVKALDDFSAGEWAFLAAAGITGITLYLLEFLGDAASGGLVTAVKIAVFLTTAAVIIDYFVEESHDDNDEVG
ncbi:hypothetical protein [Candidatus Harpocratesius sp.]